MLDQDRYDDAGGVYTSTEIARALAYYNANVDDDGIPLPDHDRHPQVTTLQCTVEGQHTRIQELLSMVSLLSVERDHWRAEAAELEMTCAELRLALADVDQDREPERRRGVVGRVWDLIARTRTRDL